MRRPHDAIGTALALFIIAAPLAAPAIDHCPAARACAEIGVQVPAAPIAPGGTALVRLGLVQGPDDGAPGGIDEVAALTVTLAIPGLQLTDCSAPGPNGLNPSFGLGPGAAGRYRAIVQNLTCAQRASCLCPPDGTPRDDYVNLLLLGTATGAAVQPLPTGVLLDIRLHVPADATAPVPLHIFSAADDSEFPLPVGAARLSIADPQAIDRTVDVGTDTLNIRITDGVLAIGGSTPTPSRSQTASATVSITPSATPTTTLTAPPTAPPPTEPPTATASVTASPTGSATVTPPVCVGDCDHSRSVDVNELIVGVGIALDTQPLSVCPAFDCDGTGRVGVTCLIAAVNAALGGCPMPALRP